MTQVAAPQLPPTQTPRRVKVYALYNSNWIDLGTGSCTYHRGIAHRKRRKIGKPDDDPGSSSSPDSSKGGLSIAGRAAREREAARLAALEEDDDAEYEEIVQFVELDDSEFEGNSSISGLSNGLGLEGLEENEEEEAAWIEVLKEGRWKTDPAAPTAEELEERKAERARRKQEKASRGKGANGSSIDEDDREEGSDDEDDLEIDEGQEYERVWTSRIERPFPNAKQGYDMRSFSPQPGSEGENEEVIGRYRRQQDTLIVWKSSTVSSRTSSGSKGQSGSGLDDEDDEEEEDEDIELALSFAATSGCAEVWEYLKQVHKRWETSYIERTQKLAEAILAQHSTGKTASSSSASPSTANSSGAAGSGAGAAGSNGNGAGAGLGVGAVANLGTPASQANQMPNPELGNLAECEKRLKLGSRTAVGREKLAHLVTQSVSARAAQPRLSETTASDDC